METRKQLEFSFEDSIIDVFTTNISENLQAIPTFDLPVDGDIIASSIGLIGRVEGDVELWLSGQAALSITKKMLCAESVDPEIVMDMMGEITNMIAGGMKLNLDKVNFEINISLPSTMKGTHLQASAAENSSMIKRSYCCDDSFFRVLLTDKIDENQKKIFVQLEDESSQRAVDELTQLLDDSQSNQEPDNDRSKKKRL